MRCSICNQDKDQNNFSSGEYRCKECNCIRSKKRYLSNIERERKRAEIYRLSHPEIIAGIAKERSMSQYSTKYYNANKEKINLQQEEWRRSNIEKVRAYARKSAQSKCSTIVGKLNSRMHSAIRVSLKGDKKGRKWESLAGYTVDQLKAHLEKNFVGEMSWERLMNGDIHIDHKIPISAFNFVSPEDVDFKKCWSLNNLRPMWAKDNILKSNKLAEPFQPSLLIKTGGYGYGTRDS